KAGSFVDLAGDGVLEQDAADAGVGIKGVNLGQELLGCGLLGKLDGQRLHADTAAGVALHAVIGGGSGVGANKNGGKDGRTHSQCIGPAGLSLQVCYPLLELNLKLLGIRLAIEDQSRHGTSVAAPAMRRPAATAGNSEETIRTPESIPEETNERPVTRPAGSGCRS